MTGAGLDQPIMEGRFAHPTTGIVLLEGVVGGIQQPQTLTHPFLQILTVALERHVAAYVDFPEVHRRMSVANPLGGDLAHASG